MTDRFRMLPSYHYEDNTDGNLLKSVGKPLRDYKIEGNCFQDGTTSPDNPIKIQCCGEKTVNLFDINGNINTRPNNGTVINEQRNYIVGENQLNVCGSSSSNLGTGQVIKVQTGDIYTVSFRVVNISGGNIGVTIYKHGTTEIIKTAYGYNIGDVVVVSFTATTDEILVGFNKGGVAYGDTGCIIENIQLQKGNTATPYEPYGYKVPVTVGGKNLFDKSLSPLYGIKAETAINYYGTVFYDNACTISMLKPDTTYTVSFECECTENVSADVTLTTDRLGFMLYSGISGYSGIPLWIDKAMTAGEKLTHHATFTTPSNLHDLAANYRLILYGNNYHDSNGVSTKPYIIWRNIKFQEGIPKTYNIYLDEPLRKVGDYADYVDFKNGKVARYVKNLTAGNINNKLVQKNADYNDYKSFYINRSQLGQMQESFGGVVMSNNFQHSLWKDIEKSEGNYVWTAGSSTGFRIHKNFLNGYDECTNDSQRIALFKQWVIDNNVNLMYIKDTLTETPISLPKILTEKHTNIISVGTTLQPSKVNYQYYKGGK